MEYFFMREKQLEDLLTNGHVYLRPKDKEAFREHALNQQDFKCAVCDKDLAEHANTNRHIDHCHKHKTVRGVLCATCNLVLGKIERAGYDSEWLHKLSEYLQTSSTNIVYPEKIVARRKTKKSEMNNLKNERAWSDSGE